MHHTPGGQVQYSTESNKKLAFWPKMAFVVLQKKLEQILENRRRRKKKLGRLTEKNRSGFPDFLPKMTFVVLTKKLEPNPRFFVVTKKNCVVLRKTTGGLGGI